MPDRPRFARSHFAAALLAVLLLTTAAYWRAVDGDFQFDDRQTVEQSAAVKDLRAFLGWSPVGDYFRAGRPVTDLTFALNYRAGRLEPRGYHLANLAIHLAAVVLAWAFARSLLRLSGALHAEWTALAAAGIFALHPLQSEAVSYVSQRSESLASGLVLASLLFILAAERRGLGWRALPFWAAALAAFALALGAKAIAVTLPVAWLLLVALVPAPGRGGELLPWRRRLMAFAPFAAWDALFMWRALAGIEGRPDAGFSVQGLSAWRYLATELRVLATYLRLLLWPAGLHVDWDFPVSTGLGDPAALLAGLLLLGLAAGAAVLWWRSRGVEGGGAGAARVAAFGVAWFFLVLSVTSSVVPLADVLAEHRVYLASLGIVTGACGGVAWLLARWAGTWASPAAAALAALAWGSCAVALHHRNAVWETRRALWTDCAEKSPRKARVHLSLAYAALAEGKVEESVAVSRRALALAEGDPVVVPQVLRNLSTGLVLLGRPDEAEALLRDAQRQGHLDADGHNNLAVVLLQRGRLDEAEALARRALALAPEKSEAWNTLGEIALRRGDAAGALPFLDRSIAMNPDNPVRHLNRGRALAALGRVEEACATWQSIRGDRWLRASLDRLTAAYRCEAR